MKEKTLYALKSIVRLMIVLLYESNAEAEWINKDISNWGKNPVWKWYWNHMAKIAFNNKIFYTKIYNRL